MTYPTPIRFIRAVADRSRCADAGDAEIEVALDWLREQIFNERSRMDAYYERRDMRLKAEIDKLNAIINAD